LDDSAIVVAVARVVGALHLSAGGASAGVAVLLPRLADSQFHALVLAFAGHRVVLAVNLSILHALAGVASISFVEGGADLNNSSHVVAGAHLLVADDLGIRAALARLASVQVGDSGGTDLVAVSVVVARAFLRVTGDHSRLSASASVASIGVNPRESDLVLLSSISEAEADFVFALDLSVLHASTRVALVRIGLPNSHWLVGHWVTAAFVVSTCHLEVGLTGASIAAGVSWLGEGLPARILHTVVVAFAVDTVVRNHVATVLRAGESGASVSGSNDLTHGHHTTVVRTTASHQRTNDGSVLGASARVAILLKGLPDGVSDSILNA